MATCTHRNLHGLLSATLALAWSLSWSLASSTAGAAPVELVSLQRSAQPHAGIAIDYVLKVDPPRAVVEVLRRGVPLHFQAQVTLLRPRWWWRDERIARASRSWRLAWQPLTSDWRVGQGGLAQQHATLEEALASMARASNWLVAEPHRVSPDERLLVLFTWRLDTAQLPAPMQIEAGGADWNMRVDAEFGVAP
jgi:Domain of unknown function (DUF4390)